MAEQTPLKRGASGIETFASTDTIPASALPVPKPTVIARLHIGTFWLKFVNISKSPFLPMAIFVILMMRLNVGSILSVMI